ncbi:MAG TPA: choline/ethanolamine kinase family protein [Dongiaceae bacterium]|nr:choline/ethanolamine kinase family protein [Dongiaceae bacterium]
MIDDVEVYLKRVPDFEQVDFAHVSAERLGGLTNRNYKVTAPLGTFVLRVPGEGTSEYISRENESVAARIASEIGVNAPLLYFDGRDGVQLTRFIEGGATMNVERFKDLGSVKRAAQSLRRVHDCGRPFKNRFELFQMIDEYLDFLGKKDAPLPDGYHDVKREAEAVRKALNARPLPIVPCHCDPLAENFLDTGKQVYVIDWEYAGNNDPMWDLGDVSVEAAFGPEQDEALLLAYFGGAPSAGDRGRMVLYKAMCDLLWTLWGIIQHVNKNPADDFWAYAVNRFTRCKTLMGRGDFGTHIAAVQRG